MEKEEQRKGRNKKVSINRKYINSGAYRRKFDQISESKELNKLLYNLATEMLEHRTGTLYEDMYWIDMDTCKVIASETNSLLEEKIIYSRATEDTIQKYDNIITIHSHPNSLPPSVDDFNSNFHRNYKIGVIVGHNGNVFVYSSNEKMNRTYCEMRIAKYFNEYYNNYEAQCLALNEFVEKFDIDYKEVTE